jgi:transcriptional regulator with XRE-family HTH domain
MDAFRVADTKADLLRAVIRRRMDEAGLNARDLAARTESSPERFYKALDGSRGLTPATLRLIAQTLGTTVTSIKMEAGVLTRDELQLLRRRVPFADYIGGDPLLSEESKDALIRVYEGLTGVQPVGPPR